MKILALDSSGLVASIAILEDDNLIAEYTIHYKKTHSQTLLPMISEVTNMVELDLHSIDAIALASGPGSFTGLRIGSSTAKGLGLALDKVIVGVPTVDGLAYNMYGSDKLICPIMDARRGQVYTGLYEFINEKEKDKNQQNYKLSSIQKQCAVMIEEIVDQINKIGREVIFLGDGVPVFAEQLADIVKVPYSYAPANRNRQSASSIAVLGGIAYKRGEFEAAEEHQPDYLRLSQAERERLEKKE